MERRARATPLDEKTTMRVRYDQGGGRMYVQNAGDETRDLIGDFYGEGDREFYFYVQTDIDTLCAAWEVSQREVVQTKQQREELREALVIAKQLAIEHAEAYKCDKAQIELQSLRTQLEDAVESRNFAQAAALQANADYITVRTQLKTTQREVNRLQVLVEIQECPNDSLLQQEKEQ
jgi:hypothetical protein